VLYTPALTYRRIASPNSLPVGISCGAAAKTAAVRRGPLVWQQLGAPEMVGVGAKAPWSAQLAARRSSPLEGRVEEE
jgi:hypothetical protein